MQLARWASEGIGGPPLEPMILCSDLFIQLGDEEVLVLDCREEEEWLTWSLHIPGALRMTLEDLLESSQVLPDDELIVVCGCRKDSSDARRACRLLRMRGCEAVYLKGGIEAWVHGGFPTEGHAGPDTGMHATA